MLSHVGGQMPVPVAPADAAADKDAIIVSFMGLKPETCPGRRDKGFRIL